MPSMDDGIRSAPDANLVRRLKADDQNVFKELVETHWSPLVQYAHRVLSGLGDPEGTVQTVFGRLWSRRNAIEESGSLRALLYTMVRNACLDELRKRRRENQIPDQDLRPAPPKTPYEDVHGAELQRLAAAAVARLPERRREVFRLIREEGLSYREVAEIMSLSTQTVANHMSLAMADLRAALRPYLANREPKSEGEEENQLGEEQIDG